MIDALVIGAGPSGSRTAWNLAKAGYSTMVVEEDEVVGEPCQCAGLITPRTFEYLGYERPVFQEMNGARLWGPNDSFLDFQASETKALVIARPELDRSIANKAIDAGAGGGGSGFVGNYLIKRLNSISPSCEIHNIDIKPSDLSLTNLFDHKKRGPQKE